MKMLLRSCASTAWALIVSATCFAQHYTQTDLVSNTAGVAAVTDPQLINAWGLSRGSGSAWWVSDNTTGFSTLYNGAGAKQSLIVTIPPSDPKDKNTPMGTPTGTIFNGSQTDFLLSAGNPAVFLFSTIDGTIAGWNPKRGSSSGGCTAFHECCDRCQNYRRIQLHGPDQRFRRRQTLPVCSKLHQGPRGCL